MIADYQKKLGVKPRAFTKQEILERILLSSVNEACKILQERVAYRPSDIDVMWLNGFGFPRYRGGLMYWADQLGVDVVYGKIKSWHEAYGGHWQPSLYLQELAERRLSFKHGLSKVGENQ